MTKKIIFTDEQQFQIKQFFNDGLHIKDIAVIFKVEKRNIAKILHGHNKTGRFIGASFSDVFTQNSTYSKSNLRLRVLKENLLNHICDICKCDGYWNKHKLHLQIDHINGISNDHRLENLRFLCPNCHSQTDTFGSRNYKLKQKDKLLSIPLSVFENVVKNSKSLSEIVKTLGLPIGGGSLKQVNSMIKDNIINASHIFNRFRTQRLKNNRIKTFVLLSKNCYDAATVKKRIIEESLLNYKCNWCDLISEWNGKKLVLQLDHINGINSDHRLENLRFLCPNCHSQTPTFMLGARRLSIKKNK